MRKVQVILIDDIDGSEAERTVQFSLDGSSYEIDLNAENVNKLEQALAPFVEKATKVSSARAAGNRATRRTATGGNRSKASEVRAWAKGQGIVVPDRGRVPNDVLEQYEAAH